jgi:hypothetical protein
MVYRDGVQQGIQDIMTTARERYETKTKVVTFRVSSGIYDELEEIKTKGGLSYSDLIKLGAGIAQQEIMAKLAEVIGFKNRLAELTSAIERKEAEMNQSLDEERARRLKELDSEMGAFRLFEQGWTPEEAAEKLGLTKKTASDYFENWAKGKKDKQITQRILLVKCLKKHIEYVRQQISWCQLLPIYKEHLPELEEQKVGLQQLLADPAKISKEDKQWLLTEYSSQV